MKIYSLPNTIKTLIFDIDSTLYTNEEYAVEQVDCQIRYYADLTGISHDEARKKIEDYRENYSRNNDGKKISLGNTFVAMGIPIEESIRWREMLLEPADFLSCDTKLIETIAELKKHFNLICVTNNPSIPARKTLQALGISDFFPEIIALDTCKVSKPHAMPFELAAKKTGSKINECVSIGDRYDIDISLPLQLGMGGILVDNVCDVYTLPEYLCK